MLDRVTISGADDNIRYEDLANIGQMYPFVEWGILLSDKKNRPRYPSWEWIADLVEYTKTYMVPMQLSAHYCGNLCNRIINTYGDSFISENILDGPPLSSLFRRIQLNGFNSSKVNFPNRSIYELNSKVESFSTNVILQISNPIDIIASKQIIGSNIHCLYDASRGKGVYSADYSWNVDPFRYVGFAGGIDPDNFRETLDILNARYDDRPFWIDMETGVRTNNNLDLKKVFKILEISEEYI